MKNGRTVPELAQEISRQFNSKKDFLIQSNQIQTHVKYHREDDDNDVDTLNAEDKAFWLKVRDLVKHSLSEVTFKKIVSEMEQATKLKIELPEHAIELATKRFAFGEGEKSNILKHLIEGGDLTSWGLGNAVTRMAQDVQSYDRSTELESIGFEIMGQSWN